MGKCTNARVDRDVTQQQLAKMIGTTQSIISRWECGLVEPGAFNIGKICKALRVNPRKLFQEYFKQ